MRRTARRTGAVAALAVLFAGTMSACGGQTLETATPFPVQSAWHPGLFVDGYGPVGLGPSPSATTSPSALDDTVQQALSTVGLQQSNFGDGLKVVLASDGTTLTVPSQTYCQASYPSEASRTARRRMVATTSSGAATGIATEAVYYRTAADASAALTQVRTAAGSCPSPRTASVGGQSATFTAVSSADVDVTGLVPGAERVIVSTTVDPGTGPSGQYRLTRVWQLRGRVLVTLFYSSAAATMTTQELSDVHLLATSVASGLDALKSDIVGTS